MIVLGITLHGYFSCASGKQVKVCDICGDAGLEELLATCTKCSDGAEHMSVLYIYIYI